MRYLISILFLLSTYCLSAQTVYKTPSGSRYHTATCHHVKNVSQGLSISEARKMGLTACTQCNPDQSNQRGIVSPSKKGLGIKPGEAQGEAPKSVQCKGTTKAGKRCRHMTKNVNGYCYQHEPK